MERPKLIAYLPGAISVVLAIAYLLLVFLLDLRGEMKPAPQEAMMIQPQVSFTQLDHSSRVGLDLIKPILLL